MPFLRYIAVGIVLQKQLNSVFSCGNIVFWNVLLDWHKVNLMNNAF